MKQAMVVVKIPVVPPSSPRTCPACGTAMKPEMKFCGACGASMTARPEPGVPDQVCPSSAPTVAPVESPVDFIAGPSHDRGAERVIGVIGNAKKTKIFGVSDDTYTLVITSRRMIFARLIPALANAAIMDAQAQAKAGGKEFLGTVQDRMAVTFGFALRYERMVPDQVLVETPGNVAIQNSRISAIKMQLKDSGNTHYHEFKMVIESMDGKSEYMIAEDERFTNLLKTVYGDRLHMPPGYFSKAGVRIKFF
jgi:hypothetical protein